MPAHLQCRQPAHLRGAPPVRTFSRLRIERRRVAEEAAADEAAAGEAPAERRRLLRKPPIAKPRAVLPAVAAARLRGGVVVIGAAVARLLDLNTIRRRALAAIDRLWSGRPRRPDVAGGRSGGGSGRRLRAAGEHNPPRSVGGRAPELQEQLRTGNPAAPPSSAATPRCSRGRGWKLGYPAAFLARECGGDEVARADRGCRARRWGGAVGMGRRSRRRCGGGWRREAAGVWYVVTTGLASGMVRPSFDSRHPTSSTIPFHSKNSNPSPSAPCPCVEGAFGTGRPFFRGWSSILFVRRCSFFRACVFPCT